MEGLFVYAIIIIDWLLHIGSLAKGHWQYNVGKESSYPYNTLRETGERLLYDVCSMCLERKFRVPWGLHNLTYWGKFVSSKKYTS